MSITRNSLDNEGKPFIEECDFCVPVCQGCCGENRIIFPREGDHFPGTSPGDLMFVIKEKPHSLFWKYGYDLFYTARVSFYEKCHGVELDVPTLAGTCTHMKFTPDEINNKTEIARIEGGGLPHPNDPQSKGDIIITFDVRSPQILTPFG